MGLIDRAILQDEIRQALNALFQNGQVPRIETTKTAVEILREPKLEFEDGQTGFRYQLIAGVTYEVILDGVTYVRKAFDVEFNGESGVVLGNASPYGYADTGEPFVIIPNVFAIISEVGSGGTSEHSIVFSKIEETETIHPIDPKFLTGVCLPVVELSTALDIGAESVNLSAEDCSAMTAVASTGTPIALKYTLDGGVPIFSVATLAVAQDGDVATYFYGAISALEGIITIRVVGNPDSGQWQAFVTQG